ncbi:MAG: BNR-4 repeat-containing protein [Planctomycetota bacterium]
MRPRNLLFVLACFVLLCQTGLPQKAPANGADAHAEFHVVDLGLTFSAPTFGVVANGAAHTQDMLVSHAGYQYMAYWDWDRCLTVARRKLPGTQWQILAFEDYRIPGEDSHNAVSIGICPNDGTIHLSFDHHSDDLNYRVSVPGLASDPASFPWDATVFGPVQDVLDPARGVVTKLTYPRFLPTPGGDLHFLYREFGSGDGRERMVDYDAASGTWSDDRVIIERNGAYTDPLGGSSSSRNPYYNRIAYDDRGTLHSTWTWRERASIRYNRDIAYALSEDGGATWLNGAGEEIASLSAGTVMDAFSPGINEVLIGAEWGLMNDQGHVVDGRGRVHVVMYHKIEPDDKVSYGNIWNSKYHHYWRDADGTWRSHRLETMGNRPKLFADDHGNLLLAYVAAGDLRIDVATPEADYLDWRTVCELEDRFGSSVQADHFRFDRSGILSVALQRSPVTPGDPSDLGVVDVMVDFDEIRQRLDEPRSSERVLPTERDTWVRGGSHAGEAHGGEEVLAISHAATEEDQRLTFARFFLQELIGEGAVKRAVLRLDIAASGGAFAAADLLARRCTTDNWSESMSWNDRPSPTGPAFPAVSVEGRIEIDVTEAIASELANGGQRITFELSSLDLDPNGWVILHSKEAGAGTAPRLVIEQINWLEPIADTHVRSGTYSQTNYGTDDRLVIKEDGNDDYDRVAFLRFDVSPLIGTGEIGRIFLVTSLAGMSPLGKTTPYAVHSVSDDTWDEIAVTWDTQPALGAERGAHFGRASLQWDVTADVLAAMAGDGLCSIGLRSDREGGARAINLWSREAADPSKRPRLVVRYR